MHAASVTVSSSVAWVECVTVFYVCVGYQCVHEVKCGLGSSMPTTTKKEHEEETDRAKRRRRSRVGGCLKQKRT